MKKTAVFVLFIVFFASSITVLGPTQAASSATLTVDSATQQFPNVHVGDTIKVNLTVSNVENLWAWDITELHFDPAVLSLVTVSEGPMLTKGGDQTLFASTSSDTYAAANGLIRETSCVILAAKGVSGTGVIASLSFKVLAAGNSQIQFGQITLLNPSNNYDSPIPCTAVNATIYVGTSTGNPTSAPTINPTVDASDQPTSHPSSTPSTYVPQQTQTASTNPTTQPSSDSDDSIGTPEFPTLVVAVLVGAAAAVSIVLVAIVKSRKK